MEKYFKKILKINIAPGIGVIMLLLWLCANMALTGCKKDRLFTHVDSIGAVPSQFHFFNTFTYDASLSFSVDGLTRETVKEFTFSNYYPSSSAFNLNSAQPNSKLININDPTIKTQYANAPNNNIFQFKPNTSYIIFTTNASYDTISAPIKTTVPLVNYYPEDTYHPFDGTTGIRVFNSLSAQYGPNDFRLSVTPNIGQGTTNVLVPIYTVVQPVTAASSYVTTQAGLKKITLNVSSNPAIQFTYLPLQLDNGKNYSFFVTGDIRNFLAGIQPRPRVFVVEDGNPSNLRELTLSSTSYPGNLSSTAQVTVINAAYNVPGVLTFGKIAPGAFTQNLGVDVTFNQTTINILRWPLVAAGEGLPLVEAISDSTAYGQGAGVPDLTGRIATNSNLTPGAFRVSVTPGGAFTPVYNTFDYNFEKGLAYTVCLLPNNTTSQKSGELVLQNDNAPDANLFKLRIINLLGGSTQVDVHNGSPSGPIIASAVTYGQANEYISFKPNLNTQNLYITTAGSKNPLFQKGIDNPPISLPFTAGNSGTLYLMGLLNGTPYSGYVNPFGPYVYYNSDAYINANSVLPSGQLYY